MIAWLRSFRVSKEERREVKRCREGGRRCRHDPIHVDADGRQVDEWGEPVQELDWDSQPGGADDDG